MLKAAGPVRHLSVIDAMCVIVGIVVAAGIFRAPTLVAAVTGSAGWMLAVWVAGAVLCLCGALCYAELASAYPQVGGEYVYLRRSYGPAVGFLFVWARVSVIQTGATAAMAYVFGGYAAALAGWGRPAPMLFALAAVAALTVAQVVGLRVGRWTQNVLTAAKVLGVAAVVVVGLVGVPAATAAADPPADAAAPAWPGFSALGLAMVFVLYTYGGWNEAAYVAGEVRRGRRNMLWVLTGSIAVIAALYLTVNLAYLRVLGVGGMAASSAVAADTMVPALGQPGRIAVTALVAMAALGAIDGCLFTGSRSISGLGADYPLFRALGRWHSRFRTPAAAIGVQCVMAMILVSLPALGPWMRDAIGDGFGTAVEYTAPAFWAFLLLTGTAVFVLRARDRHVERPFRVPLFWVTAPLFCLMSAWMLYRSLDYRLGGAVVGAAVLLAGVPIYLACRRTARAPEPAATPDKGPTSV